MFWPKWKKTRDSPNMVRIVYTYCIARRIKDCSLNLSLGAGHITSLSVLRTHRKRGIGKSETCIDAFTEVDLMRVKPLKLLH